MVATTTRGNRICNRGGTDNISISSNNGPGASGNSNGRGGGSSRLPGGADGHSPSKPGGGRCALILGMRSGPTGVDELAPLGLLK